ncbi:FAD-dependent oxidoreductase [Streptomyces hoynatensis]|uniref:FAD-dependent oxidoreductase n=1 Tax=Streptomyces hoynatensis TaxID=1141874 RepID=A0A3A9Z6K6_9ACTN|nr:FAD-dependent oxidoreductase [Streptomyces hoynatensis]
MGGGIVGACLAEELALAGAAVLVVDAGREPGHATGHAAGVAVPSLRHLGDPVLYGWLDAARGTLAEELARLAAGHPPFSRREPIVRCLPAAEAAAVLASAAGPALGERIGPAELRELLPGARVPEGQDLFRSPEGLMVDGRAYLEAVCHGGLAAGVDWRQGSAAVEVSPAERGGRPGVRLHCGEVVRGGRVVIAAGAWSGRLLPGPGPRGAPAGAPAHGPAADAADVPAGGPAGEGARRAAAAPWVAPQRGQLVVLRCERPPRCVLSSRFYLAPLPSGSVVVGATEEDAGFAARTSLAGTARLLAFALRTVPGLAEAEVCETRAGLRPTTRNGRPLVGELPGAPGVFVATGHAGHGLLTARHTARGVAAGLLREDWSGVPAEFSPRAAWGAVPAARP